MTLGSREPSLILIVGLGLIGGSLAAVSRKKFPRAKIIGISRSQKAIRIAKRKGWIDEGFRHCEAAFDALRHPEGRRPEGSRDPSATTWPQDDGSCLVILCTPVDTLKGYLRRLDRIVPAGTLVTDTGSVKGFLVRWVDRQKWRRIKFTGAHPMAGSHRRGIEAADSRLFNHCLIFVTPGKRSSGGDQIKNFWRKISSRIAVISPEEHDHIASEISHLPHLLAVLLVASVSSRSLRFAASGFLDTTRIALGDPGIWSPIFLENRKELLHKIYRFERVLNRVKKILRKEEISRFRALLLRAKKHREALE